MMIEMNPEIISSAAARPKIIILDRDGVINYDSDTFIKTPDEWKPIPGSLEAIAQLNAAGYHVVVASNQSGIERGLFDTQTLLAIHAKMHQALNQFGGKIDAIFYCPHTDRAECDCRKPKPGMLREIESRFHITLDNVPCVGDSLRDLQAASVVNALPVLVRTGKGEQTAQSEHLPPHTQIFANLAGVAAFFLGRTG
ncbi:MAG: D-glycero-beta-D-manno-heptose 1,7-bisphosphate 7-phosphatase [Burkholderiales bacterium]|jgi:D-glycero-D-manno-heptose 1,7-bisphosphate phosphatase|nr:D-glycero-beta-D-manno-heptose 1,7-bisphosphate 7-phosphatase [Burkholderiales bacterium]